jgi:hypothetical protein
MKLGNVARVLAVSAACFAAAASATSSSNTTAPAMAGYGSDSAPPPQQMDPSRALGLWRSTFVAGKMGPDDAHGGGAAGAVQGVWLYQRQGQEIVGYFYGTLRGNVLQFHWQEPDNPPLTGEGYLVFDQDGRQYSGRWWSDKKDRVGDWNGWRQSAQGTQQAEQPQPYAPQQPQAGYPQQPQYPQQPAYPQQPQAGYPQQAPQSYPPPQQPAYPQSQQQPAYPGYPQQPAAPQPQPQPPPAYPQQPA